MLFLLWLHLFILSGVISPLLSSRILGNYQPGEFIFQCPIFLPFHTTERNGKPLQYFCLESPINSMKIHTVGSCFFIHSDNLHLLTDSVKPFIFKLVIDTVGFNLAFYITTFSLIYYHTIILFSFFFFVFFFFWCVCGCPRVYKMHL